MAQIGPAGSGLVSASPHPSILNLWVREVDPTTSTVYGYPLILTGLIKGVADAAIDKSPNTYLHGCTLTQVDGAVNVSGTWENTGTVAAPVWQRWNN